MLPSYGCKTGKVNIIEERNPFERVSGAVSHQSQGLSRGGLHPRARRTARARLKLLASREGRPPCGARICSVRSITSQHFATAFLRRMAHFSAQGNAMPCHLIDNTG